MNIHINKNGQKLGPFSLEEVNKKIKEGLLNSSDLAWQEGLPDWLPLSRIEGIEIQVAQGSPPPVNSDIKSTAESNNESNQTLNIAKAQKGILWCILANFLCYFIPFGFLIVLPFQIYYIYKLAQELECNTPILWCIGMLIPLFSLILLFILSQKATGHLQREGFKIGLMGANLDKVRAKTEM